MSKKKKIIWSIIIMIVFLVACSDDHSENGDQEAAKDTATTSSESSSEESATTNGLSDTPPSENKDTSQVIAENKSKKMMVYEARIELETDNYDQFHQTIENRMKENDAYIVETSIHKTEHGNRQGHIRLRVPQENFQPLITDFEKMSDNIISKDITSRDVTEEYVDLESRLGAKEKIETRLLSFLEQAEVTEDLIKISQDLERVQSEIEVLKGKMNYLSHQSDFSTITLSITETRVVVPKIEGQQLNTWEKTKQAFFSSINHLANFFSGVVVFLVGYSPILIPILGIGLVIWWLVRKRKIANKPSDE